MQALVSSPCPSLAGDGRPPGDPAIARLALLSAMLATGESEIHGLADDPATASLVAAVRALGAEVRRDDDGVVRVRGAGAGTLAEPEDVIDVGDDAAAARLLAGVIASHPMTAVLAGQGAARASLREPMAALARMGATLTARDGDRLPLTVVGTGRAVPVAHRPSVASADLKAALLLAGLNAPGETSVLETTATADHCELMLRHFGAEVRIEAAEGGGTLVAVRGEARLTGRRVDVPGDPDAAAAVALAAVLVPGSDVTLRGVGLNPGRTALLDLLGEMGAEIELVGRRFAGGEPSADLSARAGDRPSAILLSADRTAALGGGAALAAVAAAFASGTSVLHGLGAAGDGRLARLAEGLAACGVRIEVEDDDLVVHGGRAGGRPAGGATVSTRGDPHLALAFLILGMAAAAPVGVDDAAGLETIHPGLPSLLGTLGARIAPGTGAP